MRIGVFGGTFDPIHLGHLAAASEVHAALGFDLTLVVPAEIQPFKDAAAVTPAHHRLEMARIAVEGDPRLEVSSVDIERGAPTFTIDTLRDIRALHSEAELFFVTGADSLATLDDWRAAEELRALASFVGVTRPGYSLPDQADGVTFVEVPALRVSSTDVRRRVATGMPIKYLVPEAVEAYIRENGLYEGVVHG